MNFEDTLRLLREQEQNSRVGPQGLIEALAKTASGTAATAGGGLSGLWDLLTGGDINSAVQAQRDTTSSIGNLLDFELSQGGQNAMRNAEEVMVPLSQAMEMAARSSGDLVLDVTGSPELATAAYTGVYAAPMLMGAKGKPTQPNPVLPNGFTVPNAPKPAPRLSPPTPELPPAAPRVGLQAKPAPAITLGQESTGRPPIAIEPQRPPRYQEVMDAPTYYPKTDPRFRETSSLELGQAGPYDPTKTRTIPEPKAPTPIGLLDKGENYSPVRGQAGFTSKLENSLLDIAERRDGDIVTGAWLHKQLNGRGVTDQELRMSGVDMKALTGANKVSIQGLLSETAFPVIEQTVQSSESMPANDVNEWDVESMIGDSAEPLSREEAFGVDPDNDMYELFDLYSYGSGNSITNKLAEWVSQNSLKEFDVQEADEFLLKWASDSADYEEFIENVESAAPGLRGFGRYFEEKAAERAERNYNNEPLYRYGTRLEDADGQRWDVEILGSDDVGYQLSIDGQNFTPNNGVYSYNEAQMQLMDRLRDQGFIFGGDRELEYSEYVRGEPEGYRENVILQDSGITDYSPSHWSDVEGGFAHLRASQRTLAEPVEGRSRGNTTYFVDEIQSDLHSDARKEGGYKTSGDERAYWTASDKHEEAVQGVQAANQELMSIPDSYFTDTNTPTVISGIIKQIAAGSEKYQPLIEQGHNFTLREIQNDTVLHTRVKARLVARLADKASQYVRSSAQYDGMSSESAGLLDALETEGLRGADGIPPQLKTYIDAVKVSERTDLARREARKKAKRPPEAPGGDDKWIDMAVKKAVMQAIERGEDSVTFANAQNQVSTWGERFRDGYDNVYEKKMPAAIKRLAKKYGANVKQVELDDYELKEDGKNWSIEITPEMKEAIEEYGIDLYGKVNKGLLKPEDEQQSNFGGLLA